MYVFVFELVFEMIEKWCKDNFGLEGNVKLDLKVFFKFVSGIILRFGY